MIIIRAKLNDNKRTYRDIAIKDTETSLYYLAKYILDSYNFYFDHCFGFYKSADIYGRGKNQTHYELFYDIGEEIDELTESVQETLVSKLFINRKDKWWMLFDYGDDLIFELECVDTSVSSYKNGQVSRVSGESPQQYPPLG